VQNDSCQAAHQRPVDTDVLQVPANFQFDARGHFPGIPARDNRSNQRGNLATDSGDQLVGSTQPPTIEFVLHCRIGQKTAREGAQCLPNLLAQNRAFAANIGFNSSPKVGPDRTVRPLASLARENAVK